MDATTDNELARLNEQVSELCNQGCYEQAIPIATQICKIYLQVVGEKHLYYAQTLNNLAKVYQANGNNAEALSIFRRENLILRSVLGEEHPDYIQSLNNLVGMYYGMGNYTEAASLLQQASEILRRILGEEHPDYLQCINDLADLYQEMGNFAGAIPLIQQKSEFLLKEKGEEDPDYTSILNTLALLNYRTGNYLAAESLYRKTSEISGKVLGVDDPNYAASLNNLAEVYKATGNYIGAVSLFQQAIKIWGMTLGEENPTYATGLDNLAGAYLRMGNYAEAAPLYQQASEIWSKTEGEDHPNYASSQNLLAQCLNSMVNLYDSTGDYAKAVPLLLKVVEIQRRILGEEHLDYATSLINLARPYREMGNYTEAKQLLLQACEIRRKVLGEEHPDYAISLMNLATVYLAMDNTAEAVVPLQQASDILLKGLDEKHPEFVSGLNNIAVMFHRIGLYGIAEFLYRKVCDIRRQVLGEEHPDYATSLNNLALLYCAMDNYAAAVPYLEKATEIRRKVLGEEHPVYAQGLLNLALLYLSTNRTGDALVLEQKVGEIHDRMIGQVFSISAENQRLSYLSVLQQYLNAFLSLITQYFADNSEAKQAGLDLVLRRKGIDAEALASQRDALLGGRYPDLQDKLRELTTLQRQIAQKTLAGPTFGEHGSYQKLLKEMTAQKEFLEGELVQQIPEMNMEHMLHTADHKMVALALPPNTALVEFVRFDFEDITFAKAWSNTKRKPAHYVVFILHAGESNNISMIDLGEADTIEKMIASFRASITGGDRSLRLYEQQTTATTSDGKDLRRVIYDTLLAALNGCTRLFLAPDGDLTRLPFEALPTDDNRCLIDDYCISYLGVGRDLLRIRTTLQGHPTSPLVVAAPNFDLGLENANTTETRSTGIQSRTLRVGAVHFDPLPGTLVEGEKIAARLGVQPWLGGAVLEGPLKAVPSPRILHIATHGFFLEDRKREHVQGSNSFEAFSGESQISLGRLANSLANPLLRSGLALAGANTWLQEKKLPLEAEDGILTAEDVSGLDLIDTELVVLSACETGLGEVRVGEGVFGLRRSFLLAGAHTLVMSLWKVPDQQTQELMEDFYRRILEGEPRAEALREAQLAMKAKCPEPLYWGAFICQGDPGALIQVNI